MNLEKFPKKAAAILAVSGALFLNGCGKEVPKNLIQIEKTINEHNDSLIELNNEKISQIRESIIKLKNDKDREHYLKLLNSIIIEKNNYHETYLDNAHSDFYTSLIPEPYKNLKVFPNIWPRNGRKGDVEIQENLNQMITNINCDNNWRYENYHPKVLKNICLETPSYNKNIKGVLDIIFYGHGYYKYIPERKIPIELKTKKNDMEKEISDFELGNIDYLLFNKTVDNGKVNIDLFDNPVRRGTEYSGAVVSYKTFDPENNNTCFNVGVENLQKESWSFYPMLVFKVKYCKQKK